jgi:outer membrane protein assembly factor BamA
VGGSVGESIISSPGNEYFMLRGYEIAQFVGDKALVVSGEYRFPISYPEKGRKMFPVFLQKVHGAIFADYGGAFDRKSEYPLSVGGSPVIYKDTEEQAALRLKKHDNWNLGTGAELRLTGFVGWGVLDEPLTTRIGWSVDATGGGLGPNIYIELGTSF